MSLIGYARVSTGGQELHLQTDALQSLGCDRIFTETASGAKADRPVLAACLDYLREGDTLIVWRLDRLGRRTLHLLELMEDLAKREIHFRSVIDGFDTTTPIGMLVFTVSAALAEMERNLTVERTHAGLAAARARGRKGGRRGVLTGARLADARKRRAAGESVPDIAEMLKVSVATVYRYTQRPEDEMEATG